MSRKIGSLTILTGPMNSGKTSNLIIKLSKYADASGCELKVCFVRPSLDSRKILTHSQGNRDISPKVDVLRVEKLSSIDSSKYDVIGVDEANLFGITEERFNNDLYNTVMKWRAEKKIILLSGLIGDYRGMPFGYLLDLIPIAIHHQYEAICVKCLPNDIEAAYFTKRVSKSRELVEIDDGTNYIPVCQKHFES